MAQTQSGDPMPNHEQTLQLSCGARETLRLKITIEWERSAHVLSNEGAHNSLGGDPGSLEEKQAGGNALRASNQLVPGASDALSTVGPSQSHCMEVVLGPNERVDLRQHVGVVDLTAGDKEDGGAQAQGTDPGNQGSKEGGENSLRG